MVAMKRCIACKRLKELTAANFAPRLDLKGKWSAACLECAGAGRKPARPRAGPTTPPPDASEQVTAGERAHLEASAAREARILALIRRYQAVRFTPGGDRDLAYDVLALALQQHRFPVSDGVREWSWDRGLGDLKSQLLHREWRRPQDPHADPRRVARTGMLEAGLHLDIDAIGGEP